MTRKKNSRRSAGDGNGSSQLPHPQQTSSVQPALVPKTTPTASDPDDSEIQQYGKRGRTSDPGSRYPPAKRQTTSPPRDRPGSPTQEEKMPTYHLLEDADQWLSSEDYYGTAELLIKHSINFKAVVTKDDRIAVTPNTPEDNERMLTMFHEYEVDYSEGPEKRPLIVVIRGIPTLIPTAKVMEDIEDQGYGILGAKRMFDNKGKPTKLLLVKIANNHFGKRIFQMRTCCHLEISVEEKKKTEGPAQCYNCQMYGHYASSCCEPPKCCKCAGDHLTSKCQVPRTEDPRCINCTRKNRPANHAASSRQCPSRPAQPPVTAAKEVQKATRTSSQVTTASKSTSTTNLAPPSPPPRPMKPPRTQSSSEEDTPTRMNRSTNFRKPHVPEAEPLIRHLHDWIGKLSEAKQKDDIQISKFYLKFLQLIHPFVEATPLPNTPDRMPQPLTDEARKRADF